MRHPSRDRRLLRLLLSAMLLASPAPGGAITVALSEADIARALKIGRESEQVRSRFHAPYVIPVNDATVERVEVITEFRRYVMAAEEQVKLGNWIVAQGGTDLSGRSIKAMVRSWHGRVSIRTGLRFHPQNTYGDVPPVEHVVGDPPIAALDVIRTPITAPASGPKQGFQPLMGAVIETAFDAALVARTSEPIRILLGGQEIKRLTVDFSRLE
jgi:hypothetical protein